MLVDIHGGPHNAWNGAADPVHLYHQELAARGWAVLLVNPRASDGYGAEFYTATAATGARADAKDFLEPIDTLIAEGVVDPDRLAVTGYSYGGYMTCYLTSHDQRFAAAVAGGVCSDLASFAGTSDAATPSPCTSSARCPGATRTARRAVADHPGRRRAHADAGRARHRGLRCPIGQAQQWHTALRERGVPTELVLYPGGSHLFILDGPPSQRIDFNERVRDWVERYAGDAAGPRPSRVDAAHWQRRLDTLARAAQRTRRATGHPADRRARRRTGHRGARRAQRRHRRHTTTDSLFQIGSISKVWTTTVVMQLVDEGKLDLDAPGDRGAARTAPGRSGRDQTGHPAALAHPHQRHRRRHLHRHRPGRRLPSRSTSRCSRTRPRTTRSARPGPTATPGSSWQAG